MAYFEGKQAVFHEKIVATLQCDQRWSFPTKVVVFEPLKSEKNSVVGGRFCGRFRGQKVATTIFALLVIFY